MSESVSSANPVRGEVSTLEHLAEKGLRTLAVKPRMRGWIHTYAVGVAAIAVAVLVAFSATVSATAGWSTLVYGVTVCGIFGISAVYHRVTWQSARTRIRMKRADHSMIFLFIAGSYTPFALLGCPAAPGSPC